MDNVARIAAGLDNEERQALVEMASNPLTCILFSPVRGSVLMLRRLGLVEGLGDATHLSQTGLAVRTHIMENHDG